MSDGAVCESQEEAHGFSGHDAEIPASLPHTLTFTNSTPSPESLVLAPSCEQLASLRGYF